MSDLSTVLPLLGAIFVALAAIFFAMKSSKRSKQLQAQMEGVRNQKKQLEDKIKALNDEKQQIEGRLRKFEWDTVPRLRDELKDIKTKSAQQVHDEYQKELEKQTKEQTQEIERLKTETANKEKQFQTALATRDAQLKQVNQQTTDLVRQSDEQAERDGRLWGRALDADAPKFEPLLTRQCTIISVVNLSNGVGKGTITANLGKLLGIKDKRVLLIDLDPKRALTGLCCRGNVPELLAAEHRTVQHFFLWPSPDVRYLFNGLLEVEHAPNCHVLVNAEKIESSASGTYEPDLFAAETQLLGKWLVDPTFHDVRFFLRKALHDPETRRRYDYVILNCAPRLSTATVNALFASDFALVPALLNRTSTGAALNLFRRLQQWRSVHLLKELRVLGVLANCATDGKTADWPQPQKDFWTSFQESAKQAHGQPVHFFESALPQSPSVATATANQKEAKAEGTFALDYDDFRNSFDILCTEIMDRIAHERR